MRKVLLALILLIASFQLFAAVSQKIFPVDSPVYQEIKDIYLATGHAMPSSTGPWSEAELSAMIDRIPQSEVPDYLKDSYNHVKKELGKNLNRDFDFMSLQFSANTSVELYAHTNTDGQTRTDINGVTEKIFTGRESWSYDMVHSNPLLGLNLEFDVKNHFYFFMAADVKNGYHSGIGFENEIGNKHFGTNIPGLQNVPFSNGFSINIDSNWPYRAFASFGSMSWNIQLGRDRINWGLGKTGNLVISDNLPYHDMMKFSAFSNSFKYTFLISSFPHKSNYYNPYQGSNRAGHPSDPGKDSIKGINLYLAHRFEGRVLRDKLSFTITEAIMYASETATIDFRIFNPMIVLHNFYNATNANSTISAELDWTPFKGFNLYGQFMMDDFAIPGGENGGSPTNLGFPNAMGYLAGASYSMEAWGGLLRFNLEGALINPYTYLRYDKGSAVVSSEHYGLDYIVSTRTYVTGAQDGVIYDEFFLGYRHGSDSIVANLNAEWKKNNFLTLSANAFFMAHGTHDKWTRWTEVGGNGEDDWKKYSVTPTSGHESENFRYDDVQNRNAVCYTLDLGLFCQYHINENLNVYGQADFIRIWNVYNIKGDNANDAQFVVGLKYSL